MVRWFPERAHGGDIETKRRDAIRERSLASKSLRWIDHGRATRGDKTRQGRHRKENERYHGDGRDIVGPEAVEQRGHEVRRDAHARTVRSCRYPDSILIFFLIALTLLPPTLEP